MTLKLPNCQIELQRRVERLRKNTSRVATDAATSLTIAIVYAHIAVKLLSVIAASATRGQQADKKSFGARIIRLLKSAYSQIRITTRVYFCYCSTTVTYA